MKKGLIFIVALFLFIETICTQREFKFGLFDEPTGEIARNYKSTLEKLYETSKELKEVIVVPPDPASNSFISSVTVIYNTPKTIKEFQEITNQILAH